MCGRRVSIVLGVNALATSERRRVCSVADVGEARVELVLREAEDLGTHLLFAAAKAVVSQDREAVVVPGDHVHAKGTAVQGGGLAHRGVTGIRVGLALGRQEDVAEDRVEVLGAHGVGHRQSIP
jgi:hypothetical protein